jgi:hypothetical protein
LSLFVKIFSLKQQIAIKRKLTVSNVSFLPAVLYGAEARTLTKKEEQTLLIFERKIFRRIYGPKYENAEWKSRTNRELEEMST